MKEVGSLPTGHIPLRKDLPQMRAETEARLIAWGEKQKGCIGWLLKRSAQYWDQHPMHLDTARPIVDEEKERWDAHHRQLEATAALDLLRWRTGGGDREAVEQLRTFEEVAR